LSTPAGVVIPIRGFSGGKSRLEALGPERAWVVAEMASRVLAAARPLPVTVVTSAREVRAWAAASGVPVLDDPGSLDLAAVAGVAWVRSLGLPRAVIAHADLPLASTLEGLARDGGRPVVAVVPCHRDDGTPVLSVPSDAAFRFAYGPGSFRRHAAEARRLRLGFRVVRDAALAFDVDADEDLSGLGLLADPHPASALG
jgi:2-phospho-L-lactate/phosphoenolpyruvate guanylyltransferase